MKLILHRDYRSDQCTLGTMTIVTPTESYTCQTMERPWIALPGHKGGLSGKSCVPEGLYKLERHNSEAHPMTWALVNPDLDVTHWPLPHGQYSRSLVLIHVANFASELRGCIAPGGTRVKDDHGTWMVTSSRKAMLDIKRLLPWDDSHTLEIR